jgi:hypothetical protein
MGSQRASRSATTISARCILIEDSRRTSSASLSDGDNGTKSPLSAVEAYADVAVPLIAPSQRSSSGFGTTAILGTPLPHDARPAEFVIDFFHYRNRVSPECGFQRT